MKRSPSGLTSSGASDRKIKFSQSEMRTLIEVEVSKAVEKNETKLQGLIETIQQLDCGVDYESSIQKLEARINTVAKRAEAALAHMTKKREKSPPPSGVSVNVTRSDSEDELVETVSQSKKSSEGTDKNRELFQMMATTKKALKEMQADNKALAAAIADLSEERPPPVLMPNGSPECKGLPKVEEKEPENCQEINNVKEPKRFVEPKVKRRKGELLSPGDSDRPKHTHSGWDKALYPPLPPTPCTSVLNTEVASYNIPQRPEVQLALIRKPASLSVLWNVPEKDPRAPPMESYSIFMTMEKDKGSSSFPNWRTLGEVKAIDLPMCVMITKYKPGHKVCVAVVGKDKFNRYGPYSEVATAAIPE